MSEQKYYPEDILVEKMESGEFGWLDYVNHYSAEWQEEYSSYCEENGLSIGMNRQLSLSVIKMLNLKLRWKTEKHRKTTNKRLHNGLWRYEQIPIHGKWICSPKCKRY